MKKLLIVAALGLMAIGFTLSADNASAEDFTPPPCPCAGCVTDCQLTRFFRCTLVGEAFLINQK